MAAREIFYAWERYDGQGGDDAALRPVVEINLTKVNVGLTGDGSSTSPYSIEAK